MGRERDVAAASSHFGKDESKRIGLFYPSGVGRVCVCEREQKRLGLDGGGWGWAHQLPKVVPCTVWHGCLRAHIEVVASQS